MLYFGAFVFTKNTLGLIKQEVISPVAFSDSKDEFIGRYLTQFLEKFPPNDGWKLSMAKATEIPENIIVDAYHKIMAKREDA